MNYLSSFLNWSDEPTQNTSNPHNQNNTYTPPQQQPQQYISPLSSLQKLNDSPKNTPSQQSTMASASAFFSQFTSSPHSAPNTYTHNTNSYTHTQQIHTHNTQTNYNYIRPSITSQTQINNMIPPSYPSAIAVTSSPPPPHIQKHTITQNTNVYNTNIYNKQVKFTPKYQKSQTPNIHTHINISDNESESAESDIDTNKPLVLPSHFASNNAVQNDVYTHTNTMGNISENNLKNKSILLDMTTANIGMDMATDNNGRFTPPPRAPLTAVTPQMSNNNSDEFVNDIVRPHNGYDTDTDNNDNKSMNQSITECVNESAAMANAQTDSNILNVLDVYSDELPSQQTTKNIHLSTPPLMSLMNDNNLSILDDCDQSETNEVNLQLYGIDFDDQPRFDSFDTSSVISGFQSAGLAMKSHKKRENNKIRVTCNNCYLWRHYTKKLDIEINNLKERKHELEQNINTAENKEQFTVVKCDDLAQENERMKVKMSELKQEMNRQKQDLTQTLIESRKKKEIQTNKSNKEYQRLMKQKNELELQYNKEVHAANVKESEILKYKNELHSLQFKFERLQSEIVQERIVHNLKEKAAKTKVCALESENKALMDSKESMNNEKNEYKLRIIALNNEIETFKQKNEITNDLKLEKQSNKLSEVTQLNETLRQKIASLSENLLKSETNLLETNTKNSELSEDNRELRIKLNNFSDTLTETKQENVRLLSVKQSQTSQLSEIETQLKRCNAENDKLMDANYELNEKLSSKKSEMDEYKNNLYSLNAESTELREELTDLTQKLNAVSKERDTQLSKCVRLNNGLKSLQNENRGLTDSISHLESIIDDTFGITEDKDRKLNRLKRKNNETELNLDRLKSKLKKHERYDRQKQNYRALHNDGFKKTHRKMDQKLDMLRKSNVALQSENETLNELLKHLKSDMSELNSQIKEQKMKYKSMTNKYESDLSQIKAENHKISAEKINFESKSDTVRSENERLLNEISALHNELSEKRMICHCQICLQTYRLDLALKNDKNYLFIQRCRNIFINSHKLTPKLTMQLIETCQLCIVVFHAINEKFTQFIQKSQEINCKFYNLQQIIIAKYTKFGLLKSSIARERNWVTPTPPITPISPNNAKASASFSDLNYSNNRNSKKSKKSSRARGKSDKFRANNASKICKIRKPIQARKPPHLESYEQIYKLLIESVANATHQRQCVADLYGKPLDFECYESIEHKTETNNCEIELDNDNDIFDIAFIDVDYDKLLINPSTERKMNRNLNHDRFESAIQKFKSSTISCRKMNAKGSVELEVAWHSYYLNEENESKVSNINNETTTADKSGDIYEVDYDMNSDLDMDAKYFELIKKVNKVGPLQKRFSIT